jgi:hypothetical protein
MGVSLVEPSSQPCKPTHTWNTRQMPLHIAEAKNNSPKVCELDISSDSTVSYTKKCNSHAQSICIATVPLRIHRECDMTTWKQFKTQEEKQRFIVSGGFLEWHRSVWTRQVHQIHQRQSATTVPALSLFAVPSHTAPTVECA